MERDACIRMYFVTHSTLSYIQDTRFIQIYKIKRSSERKVNHRCEGGNTVVSSILPFPFVFAFKETSGQPEDSRRRRRGGKKSESLRGCARRRRSSVTSEYKKLVPRLSKCLDKGGDDVVK
jgi:hypothetical protein